MKVLWLSPIGLPAVRESLGRGGHLGGGWIEALRLSLAGRPDLELGIACISETPFESFCKDGVTYFSLSRSATSTRAGRLALRLTHRERSVDYTSQCMSVVERFRPDIVHVHGT